MARFADKLRFDKEKVDGVESAVLLTIIFGGLALCVLGAAIYDIGRAFSVWSMARALLGFGALALVGGCGMSDGAGALFVDPSRYNIYHCDNLAAESKELVKRENELRGLMEKAGESTDGAVIGSFAYRSDYESVLAKEKLLQRNAVEKNCSFVSPTQFQSDQSIR